MKITQMRFYDGAKDKLARLSLAPLFLELLEIVLRTEIHLEEKVHGNGAAYIRKQVDDQFEKAGGWKPKKTGGVDWKKESRSGEVFATMIGVEVQVSARSDLLVRDVVHLRNSLQSGEIDIGVIVVPSDRMQRFLPDRTPSFSDAVRYVEKEFPEAMTFPIVLLAIEHDGTGAALPKQPRKS
jgi:hypothetical protein